jgi:ketosteroid isomerase-like protein
MSLFKQHFVTLLLCFTVFAGCKEHSNEQELTNLRQSIDAFYSAIKNGDTKTRLALFAEDALVLPNHSANITQMNGEIKESWIRAEEGWVFRLKDVQHEKIYLNGDMAYTVNTYSYTWHKKEDEPQWHKTKNVHIWEKQDGGEWKLAVDIWNSSEPQP